MNFSPPPRKKNPACNGPQKPEPNDVTRTDTGDDRNQNFHNPIHILADWMQFQIHDLWMRHNLIRIRARAPFGAIGAVQQACPQVGANKPTLPSPISLRPNSTLSLRGSSRPWRENEDMPARPKPRSRRTRCGAHGKHRYEG